MDITIIVQAVLYILMSLLTIKVIPWVKAKYGQESIATIYSIIKILVKSAEQIFNETGAGVKKKAYVEAQFAKSGFSINQELLNDMIESAVLELNKNIEE